MPAFEDYALPIIEKLPPSQMAPYEPEDLKINAPFRIPEILSEPGSNTYAREVDLLSEDYSPDQSIGVDLSETEYDAIDRGISVYGFEILAFYKSIHSIKNNPFPGQWGIFICDYAIPFLADELELYYPGIFNKDQLVKKAVQFLHRHERYHFHFDAWSLSHEAITNKPLYEDYQRSIYRPLHPSKLVVEESLANRHALDSLKKEGIGDFMYDFMDRQPGAYANYKMDTNKLRGRLAAQLIDGNKSLVGIPAMERADQTAWIANGRGYLLRDENCPVFTIHNIAASSIVAPNIGAPGFKEHNRFVKCYLNGVLDHESDHKYYRIDNGEILKTPNPHGGVDSLKPWEFDGSLKKAGLLRTEYRKERAKTRMWKKNVPRKNPKPPIQ